MTRMRWSRISARRQSKDFLKDLEIVWDRKAVAAINVAEEIEEVINARPGDGRQAQRTWFVGREEDQL